MLRENPPARLTAPTGVDAKEAAYRFICAWKITHDGCSPAIRTIAAGIGQRTHSNTYHYLKQLVADGRIRIEKLGERTGDIQVIGAVWLPPVDYDQEAPF